MNENNVANFPVFTCNLPTTYEKYFYLFLLIYFASFYLYVKTRIRSNRIMNENKF